MKSFRIFVYPIVEKKRNLTGNPYISDLINTLENNNVLVVNKQDVNRIGVLSIFRYFFQTDIFYFNWIENLPEKKFGSIQAILFLFQFYIIRLFNKKIIWTFHNLDSHYNKNYLYYIIRKKMLRFSKIIIIHTKETSKILNYNKVGISDVFYFFHPFKTNKQIVYNYTKKYDVLIWGAMNEYKGVFEFLNFCKQSKLNLSILIVGKFSNEEYFNKVKSMKTDYVTIKNTYISDEDLKKYHQVTRFVLFPYISKSVLNSGSLCFSLTQGTTIIGPNLGAFKELGDSKIIYNYNSYTEIVDIINYSTDINTQIIEKFIKKNSWDNFGIELTQKIKLIN